MLKLAFALVVIIEGEPQPKAYWSSIYICSAYAEAVEHQLTSSDDSRRRPHYYTLQDGQLNITAYCTPEWVSEATVVFDW